MTLNEFIKKYNVETSSKVSKKIISDAEKMLKIEFGEELKEYLSEYGFLAYEFAELYGVNQTQLLESDLIKNTEYLHKYFEKTSRLIAIENQGEADYYLVDSGDNVFEYDTETDTLSDTKQKLFDYILDRFQKVNKELGIE